MKLLDTTFLIHYWGGREATKTYLEAHEDAEFITTTLNLKEIAVGLSLQGNLDRHQLLSTFEWVETVPFQTDHAVVAGELEAELGQAGLDEYEGGTGSEGGEVPSADETADGGAADPAGDGEGETGTASSGTGGDETATQEGGSSRNGSGRTSDTSGGGGDGQAGLDAFAADAAAGASEADGGDESGDGDAASDAGTADGDGTVASAGTDDEGIEIVADQRELDSTIARDLSTREGVETRLETLAVGDYVLSDRVVVERKTVADFMDTLTGGDRSMFEQVGDATRHYARPVVVIEGEDLYGARNVHHKAIQGALASLAVDFGASIVRTADEDETADLLEVIAQREQEVSDREVSVHGEKQSKTLAEQQEYVVASIAEVGPVTARTLLEAFGSVEAVMTADREDLLDVSGIGEVTADRIREVVGADYEPYSNN